MSSLKKSVFLVYLMLLTTLCTAQDIREPPSVQQPPADEIPDVCVKPGILVKLPCEATGKPQPTYIWLHNGRELDLNKQKITRLEKGKIEISDFDSEDQGQFQCVASNKYGKSLSQIFTVMIATLTATGKKEVITYTGDVGNPLSVPKTEFISVPEPSYTWMIVADLNDPSPKVLIRDKRILQDLKGNLYFTSLQERDALENGRFYKLNVFNHKVDANLGGSYTRIDVHPNNWTDLFDNMTHIEMHPSRMYPETATLKVAVLEGTEMRIQCIFGGYPDVDVTWSGPSKTWPTPEESGTRLVLKTMTTEAVGEYVCTGTNRVGSDRSKITVEMHTIPKFSTVGKPLKQTLTEGETATFTCQTTEDTNPQATVEWMINGEVIKDRLPGARTEVKTIQNGKKLTIIELNRDKDIKVIQCKASNQYKTLYIDAPLNVLKRTTLIAKPGNQLIGSKTTRVVFACRANSDPSTPPSIEWQRDGRVLSFYDDSRIKEDKNLGKLSLNLSGLVEDYKAAYSGEYMCMATNGYSNDSHTALLEYRGRSNVEADNMLWLIVFPFILMLIAGIIVFSVMRKRGQLHCIKRPSTIPELESPERELPWVVDVDDLNMSSTSSNLYVNCAQGPYELIDPKDIQSPNRLSMQAVQRREGDGYIDQHVGVSGRHTTTCPPVPVPRPGNRNVSTVRSSYITTEEDNATCTPVPDESPYLTPVDHGSQRACQGDLTL